MISFIRQWLTGITCSALAAALAEELMPKGAVKQVGRLVCGLMLLWAAAGPILDRGIDVPMSFTRQIQEQSVRQQEELEQKGESVLKTLIERETAAYIVDKAEESGAVCSVQVTCAADENGLWLPWSVRIRGLLSLEQSEQLSKVLSEELGIPPQRQSYTGGEQS